MRDDSVYLEWIEDSIELIEQYLGGQAGPMNKDRFFAERLLQDAVLRRLETLAEAAGHLSDELKMRHPEVDWPKLSGFRIVLAHVYARINLDTVWQALEEHLPTLKAVLASELG